MPKKISIQPRATTEDMNVSVSGGQVKGGSVPVWDSNQSMSGSARAGYVEKNNNANPVSGTLPDTAVDNPAKQQGEFTRDPGVPFTVTKK